MLAQNSKQMTRQQSAFSVQRQWPSLGRELFALERALAGTVGTNGVSPTEQERIEQRERIKEKIIAQLYYNEEKYSRDARYCALLFVEKCRGGEIVGNPYYIGKDGQQHELPYTGLEGYYAGSEKTAERPGMTPEEIVQEEATIGAEVRGNLKKHAMETYSWASFAKLQKALEGGDPDTDELRSIGVFWAEVVRKLHVRVYHNKEFEPTLTEQIEQIERLLGAAPGRTQEDRAYKNSLHMLYQQLKKERDVLSEEEKESERTERRVRERLRQERLTEYNQFREETYDLLQEAGATEYDITVEDADWKEANIIERIRLPKTRERNEYPSIEVQLTPHQVEGYLFLAKLGAIGGDPLARSVLTSEF